MTIWHIHQQRIDQSSVLGSCHSLENTICNLSSSGAGPFSRLARRLSRLSASCLWYVCSLTPIDEPVQREIFVDPMAWISIKIFAVVCPYPDYTWYNNVCIESLFLVVVVVVVAIVSG
jgi:hypothetical protein